jgi:hypothetical protein
LNPYLHCHPTLKRGANKHCAYGAGARSSGKILTDVRHGYIATKSFSTTCGIVTVRPARTPDVRRRFGATNSFSTMCGIVTVRPARTP